MISLNPGKMLLFVKSFTKLAMNGREYSPPNNNKTWFRNCYPLRHAKYFIIKPNARHEAMNLFCYLLPILELFPFLITKLQLHTFCFSYNLRRQYFLWLLLLLLNKWSPYQVFHVSVTSVFLNTVIIILALLLPKENEFRSTFVAHIWKSFLETKW